MTDRVESQYREYLKLRNTVDPQEETRRSEIKADIAREISSGQGKWYSDRLRGRGYGFAGKEGTYGDIASHLSDKNQIFQTERKEPSLAESVLVTVELKKAYNEYAQKLLPHVRTIIKIGSSTWAENFDVRGESTDPSDLDMEVLVDADNLNSADFDNIGDPETPHAMTEALTTFLHYYKLDENDPDKVDYLSFGFKRDGRPISIHFTPTKVFERICSEDYFTDVKDHRLREFRVKAKSKAPQYTQRDGTGELYTFECPIKLVEGGQITKTPLMMRGKEGRLVLGLAMDKYFSQPAINGDTKFFEDNITKFKKGLAKYDKVNRGNFSKYPSRSQRMPYRLLESLDEEEKQYV
jgi:hypothetical protein